MASAVAKIEPQKDVSSDPHVQLKSIETADQAEITVRAYELWQARGCPIGSPALRPFKVQFLSVSWRPCTVG